jgi:hypothetical protein
VTDRLIRITAALAVVAVAGVAAIISYPHAYELTTSRVCSVGDAARSPLTTSELSFGPPGPVLPRADARSPPQANRNVLAINVCHAGF